MKSFYFIIILECFLFIYNFNLGGIDCEEVLAGQELWHLVRKAFHLGFDYSAMFEKNLLMSRIYLIYPNNFSNVNQSKMCLLGDSFIKDPKENVAIKFEDQTSVRSRYYNHFIRFLH